MRLEVTGKEEALRDLEKAKGLINEAQRILYHIPMNFGLEVKNETEERAMPQEYVRYSPVKKGKA